jgi:hypothetical protein
MNDLQKYFETNTGRLIHKHVRYFDLYERYFSRFRGRDAVILEIGVSHGGSLQMWKSYFGDKARIYGIDILPECKKFEEDRISIFIGSQTDSKFLRSVASSIPPIDIVIDDGGHFMRQQIMTLDILYDRVKDDGIYLCEDICTSYGLNYGGGHLRRGTFIEYAKRLADSLNALSSEQWSLRPDKYTATLRGLYFHDGMVVLEKGKAASQEVRKTGVPDDSISRLDCGNPSLLYRVSRAPLRLLNMLLRFFRLPSVFWR